MSAGYPYTWNSNTEYEALSVVVHNGNHYRAKKFVPMHIDITNVEFWELQSTITTTEVVAVEPLYGKGTNKSPLQIADATDTDRGVVATDNSTIIVYDGVISVKPETFLRKIYSQSPLYGNGTSKSFLQIRNATVYAVGVVKPDGSTITITDDGTISVNLTTFEQRLTALENKINNK